MGLQRPLSSYQAKGRLKRRRFCLLGSPRKHKKLLIFESVAREEENGHPSQLWAKIERSFSVAIYKEDMAIGGTLLQSRLK